MKRNRRSTESPLAQKIKSREMKEIFDREVRAAVEAEKVIELRCKDPKQSEIGLDDYGKIDGAPEEISPGEKEFSLTIGPDKFRARYEFRARYDSLVSLKVYDSGLGSEYREWSILERRVPRVRKKAQRVRKKVSRVQRRAKKI